MSELEMGGFQIQPAIDQVIQRLGDEKRPKSVAIVAAFPAHFPRLAGSESTFQEALKGLLSLMLLSTAREEIRVRVQLHPAGLPPLPKNFRREPESLESGGPWALISISDMEGGFAPGDAGVDTAELEQTFSPSEYQDCERLIASMQGWIWTELPEPGAMIIWIALPLMTSSRGSPDISFVREAIGGHLADAELEGKTIMLFTDDDSLSEELARELTEAGYRVIGCQEASEFMHVVIRESPDLVILDLQAREPSAVDLAKLLKGDPVLTQTPVLFLTTIPDPEGGYRMDAARYLVRSEGTGAMLTTIHTALSAGVPPSVRVMVAEPEDSLREQMIYHLQVRGHPVVEARSAEEALALIERTRIGVIMANAGIAQARDYWLIRQVKSIAPDIRVYVLSESLSDAEGQEAIRRGATGFGDTDRLPELLDTMDGESGE